MGFRLRVRADAGGFYARYRGGWASDRVWPDRSVVEAIVQAMPNGAHVEIVEVQEARR